MHKLHLPLAILMWALNLPGQDHLPILLQHEDPLPPALLPRQHYLLLLTSLSAAAASAASAASGLAAFGSSDSAAFAVLPS